MVNMPLPDNLHKECQKAARTLRSFTMPDAQDGPDKVIPPHIIQNAKGLVVMTVLKAGFLFSGRVGFGLVVARLPNGEWSAPSALGTGAFGAGLQIGAELTDFVIILTNQRAVDAFTYMGNVSIGGNLSVALGPVGRNAEASGTATLAPLLAYSKTKGLFAGISLEGTVFVERRDTNAAFYGKTVSSRELLTGVIPPPEAAAPLYQALRLRDKSFASFNASDEASEGEKQPGSPAVATAAVAGAAAGTARPPPPQAARPPPPVPNKPSRAKALFDFEAQQPGDLGFKVGDIIEIVERTPSQNDWWKGRLNGQTGSFPANYVQVL